MIPIFIPFFIPRKHHNKPKEKDNSPSIFDSELYKSFSGKCAPTSGVSMNATGQSAAASGQSVYSALEIMWSTLDSTPAK